MSDDGEFLYSNDIFEKYSDDMFEIVQSIVDETNERDRNGLIDIFSEKREMYEELFEGALQYHLENNKIYVRENRFNPPEDEIFFYNQYTYIGHIDQEDAFWTDHKEPSLPIENLDRFQEGKQYVFFNTLRDSLVYNQKFINTWKAPWDFLPE